MICSLLEGRLQRKLEEEQPLDYSLASYGLELKDDELAIRQSSSREVVGSASVSDIFQALLMEPNVVRKLMSTGGCWFIYDIAYCKSLVIVIYVNNFSIASFCSNNL